MSIASFFETQTVFLTGITGFIGKVLLARILQVAEPKKIFVLLRWKNSPPYQRLQETLSGNCFNSVRRSKNMTHDQFLAWANTKIVVCEGDMAQPKLGLSPIDQARITSETSIIIHNAASVRFEAELLASVKDNVYGSLELLEIGKACKNIVAYIHVSTAYTNSNILATDENGRIPIEEKIYPFDFDPEELYERLLTMGIKHMSRSQEKKIIGKHPNVYTFTKSLTEQVIIKRCGSLPLAFIRPSMVGVSYRNPEPGWYDNVSAVGGLVLLSGLGIIRYFPDLKEGIIDQIPVDYVVDAYLATAMYCAKQPTGPNTEPIIVHTTTSHLNPCFMRPCMTQVVNYWKNLDGGVKIPHSLRKPGIVEMKKGLHQRVLLDTFPWKLSHSVGKLIPSKRVKKTTVLLNKAADRARIASYYFAYFMENTWVYKNDTLLAVKAALCPADQEKFALDPSDISWDYFNQLFTYAIHHHILGEEVEPPTPHVEDSTNKESIQTESVTTLPFNPPQSTKTSATPRWSKL